MEEERPGTAEQFVPDESLRNDAISKSARKVFSRMGLACCIMLAVSSALMILLLLLVRFSFPQFAEKQWSYLSLSIISMQLVGMSLACVLLRKMPRFVADPQPFGLRQFLKCIPVCMFLAIAGNLAAILLNSLLGRLIGYRPVTTAETMAYTQIPFWLLLLLLAVIGPFMEELLFRKVLIDRMRGYGERIAVITSAAMFGLMHGNLVQCVYAFLVGLLFGYVYLKSGSIWWSYGLHFTMNTLSGVLPIQLAKDPALRDLILGTSTGSAGVNTDSFMEDPLVILLPVYALVMLALVITGLVLLIKNAKRIRFSPAPLQIPKGRAFSSVWINLGMILFVILCIVNGVYYVIQTQ